MKGKIWLLLGLILFCSPLTVWAQDNEIETEIWLERDEKIEKFTHKQRQVSTVIIKGVFVLYKALLKEEMAKGILFNGGSFKINVDVNPTEDSMIVVVRGKIKTYSESKPFRIRAFFSKCPEPDSDMLKKFIIELTKDILSRYRIEPKGPKKRAWSLIIFAKNQSTEFQRKAWCFFIFLINYYYETDYSFLN